MPAVALSRVGARVVESGPDGRLKDGRGHSAGGHLAAWAAGRAGLPPGAPGARPLVAVTAVISQAGVLALADCAREGVGGTAALDLMGGHPQDLPQRYRLADPMTAVPVEAAVLCLHSRADDAVPFAYSQRYVAAAARAGGRARLHETGGDHFTLIDPHSADWQVAADALPALLGLPRVISGRRQGDRPGPHAGRR
jgi:acetyl esterase/lipase